MLYSDLKNEQERVYDVVICGGGLAGLAQARQLKRKFPDIELLILEKRTFPLPEEKFKVGESTVEVSAYYLGETLGLIDYFENNQFTKLGFRYFTGDSSKGFEKRPEIGLSKFSPYNSFQLNRIDLENDLFQMNELAGIDQLTDVIVKDVDLADTGLHTVSYKQVGTQGEVSVKAKWVIDALGRRCLLQRKNDTHVPAENAHNASWFWVKDRVDVDKTVPRSLKPYHQRMPHNSRYFSTNHIVGEGYWVWLIPLMGGYTSIGVVTSEKYHDFSAINTKEKVSEWLKANEPVLAQQILGKDLINFSFLKNYSYSSKQIFSESRWACIGEAAVFADPYYSPGISVLSFGNSIVTNMISMDVNNQLTAQEVKEYNDYLLSLNDWLTLTIQSSYGYFHKPVIFALSTLWNIVVGWSFVMPDMMNEIYLNRNKRKQLQVISSSFIAVIYKINDLFLQWAQKSNNELTFEFIDYLQIPFIKTIYDRNVQKGRSWDAIKADQETNLKELEAFAHVIFLMAVKDIIPERLAEFSDNKWLKIDAMSLNPDDWERKGLFDPTSEPGDYTAIREQVFNLFEITNDKTEERAESEAESPFSFSI